MPEAFDPLDPFASFGQTQTVKLSRFQKLVGRTLSANASQIPHVTHHDEVDVTDLESNRASLAPGAKASPLIFLIKAVVAALEAFPHFNASLSADGDSLILKKYFHVGIAVDGPLGLLVPVLRDCDSKDITELSAELKEVSALARSKGLPLDRMQGGSVSISSLGGIGGTYFTPIINAPEVAILGVTGIQTKPVWDGSEFKPRRLLPLSLSYDHRVINGADAARFVRHIGDTLGQWRG
ncbi:2-oxo acid dehydrogenase subunit E2 [Sphingomonas sp. BIUV-7]|uniref:2-oxo acid dehydrogenase subunit E2 n=1 Tax=Sphingomonas natans TaxID=3063330 RepID=A0ABT8Y850_9SPHN|nr:2-oxo acid dehydrogenase subunit E2 [Sphingomonas sp. BIUV-7]MDO6414496.1 2-oxo acid dehydrogenase subunit E2 [Sphingomonas sp. BIUV-7]